MSYSPSRAIAELTAQHRLLRGMMDRCEEFADELDAGRCGPLQLMREVARLRLAFDAHNKFEEQMLRPVLLADLPPGALEHQIEEHVDAHVQIKAALATDETAMLREVIDSMRRHLDGEERYLLAAASLRTETAETAEPLPARTH